MTFAKSISAAALAALALAPAAAHAAGDAFAPNGLIEAAEAAGVCGDAAVVSAELTDQNTISATCADSDMALAGLPLVGSVGGAGAAAIAGAVVLGAVLAASNDDDGDAVAPADTQ